MPWRVQYLVVTFTIITIERCKSQQESCYVQAHGGGNSSAVSWRWYRNDFQECGDPALAWTGNCRTLQGSTRDLIKFSVVLKSEQLLWSFYGGQRSKYWSLSFFLVDFGGREVSHVLFCGVCLCVCVSMDSRCWDSSMRKYSVSSTEIAERHIRRNSIYPQQPNLTIKLTRESQYPTTRKTWSQLTIRTDQGRTIFFSLSLARNPLACMKEAWN